MLCRYTTQVDKRIDAAGNSGGNGRHTKIKWSTCVKQFMSHVFTRYKGNPKSILEFKQFIRSDVLNSFIIRNFNNGSEDGVKPETQKRRANQLQKYFIREKVISADEWPSVTINKCLGKTTNKWTKDTRLVDYDLLTDFIDKLDNHEYIKKSPYLKVMLLIMRDSGMRLSNAV